MSLTPHTPEVTELATLKRKLAAIEAEQDMTKGHSTKGVAENQIYAGRSLRRVVDLFVAPQELVMEADSRTKRLATDENTVFTSEQNARYNSYLELMDRAPILKRMLEDGAGESLQVYFRNLRTGSDRARSDDTAKLKIAVVDWVNLMVGPSTPPLRTDSKLERGLDNDNTGWLLCPGEFSWDDLIVRGKIREGHPDYLVTAQSWPNFMYEGFVCDIDNLEKGLFRSALLVKAFKSVFTSPSSASEERTERLTKRARTQTVTRSNVATLIAMGKVTPRAIAYVAVQLRFAMSSMTAWRMTDIDFSHVEFYGAIVGFFEDAPGPCAQAKTDELIAWWNHQIFGRRTGVQVRRNKLRVTASHQWHDWLLRDGLSRAINEMDN